MWGMSVAHWALVLVIVMVLFGRNAMSRTMSDLGKTLREIRKIPENLNPDA